MTGLHPPPIRPRSEGERQPVRPTKWHLLSSPVPVWHVVSVGIIAAALAVSASGGGDPDLFWHRVLGRVWFESLSVRLSARDPISYTDGLPWHPTAWLMEVVYDRIVTVLGYTGIEVLRLLVTLALVALLARFVCRRLPAERAAPLLALVAIPVSLDIQDRPQTISFVLAAVMLPAVEIWLREGRLPSVLAVAGYTWLWANIHGLWIIIPGLLALALVSVLPDWNQARTAAARLAAALLAATVTPVGPELLLQPFRILNSTSLIVEWKPTALSLPFCWGLAGSLVLIFVGCARRRERIGSRTIMYVLAMAAFSLLAYRNVTVSTILLLPVTVDVTHDLGPRINSDLRVPAWVVGCLGTFLCLAGASAYLREPVISDHYPRQIATRLADEAQEVRVLNDYNIAGYLREFGGPNVRLAIDGRADRYGDARLQEYTVLSEGEHGWRRILHGYQPDMAVLVGDSALVELMVHDGWQRVLRDGDYVLMRRPR